VGMDGNGRVEAGDGAGGGDGLGEGFGGIGFVIEPLTLEVGRFDVVAIDEAERANASAGEGGGVEGAEGTAAYNGDAGGEEAFLPGLPDGGKEDLPGIAVPLVRGHSFEEPRATETG